MISTSTTRWRPATLKDLVVFQRGFDITKAEQQPGAIPVVSSSGVNSYHSSAKVDGPGVIIGRKGSLGTVHFIAGSYWPHDTTLWSKNLYDHNPLFVYYFLNTLNLERYDVGNSNPTLNRNHIHKLNIRIPDRAIQNKIAEVLSAYDDLIENNRRRIQLLEQVALLIYKEWFVHLRFPGHENIPVVDGVPEGWDKTTVGDSSCFVSRGITPKYDPEAEGVVINQKCIRDRRVSLELARNQSKPVPQEKRLRYGDVLINSTGKGTLGRVAQFIESIDNCTVDSHVTIARPRKECPAHLFGHAIASKEEYLANSGRGATNQTELAKETVKMLPILIPCVEVVEKFEALAVDTSAQIHNLCHQNVKLAQARNLLLPKLMSGQIKV